MNKGIEDYNFIKQLQSLPFIEEIWLYGSRSRGDNHKRSDIDLAILCSDSTDQNWVDVLNIIEKADTLLKIDCIRFDKNRLSKDFYENIIKDKKVIYAKNKN